MSGGTARYDRIGLDYADLRKPDPRIARDIDAALGHAETVLNVGAGTGSYEPQGRRVTAIEPSAQMIAQRRYPADRIVQGHAEDLPFSDQSFDAAMAILTVHHWAGIAKGLSELVRVTRGPIVLLTFDPAHRGCWLADYLPQLTALDEAQMPPMGAYAAHLGPVAIAPVMVPCDCSDGFLHAYWQRPGAYLDPRIRRGISSFWALDDWAPGLARLETDLASGAWHESHAELLTLTDLDAGYRLVTRVKG